MLPKKNRVDTSGVGKIFKEGRTINTTNLTFKFLTQKFPAPRFSVIVPKSVAKLATRRNLLRRCGYKALGKHSSHFPLGVFGVFIFKKPEEDILKLQDEIKNIFNKIN